MLLSRDVSTKHGRPRRHKHRCWMRWRSCALRAPVRVGVIVDHDGKLMNGTRPKTWCKRPGGPRPQGRGRPPRIVGYHTNSSREGTAAMETLHEEALAAAGARPDGTIDINAAMRSMLEGLLNAVMDEQASKLSVLRNGYRERGLDTHVSTVRLRIPKLREGSYFPRRRRALLVAHRHRARLGDTRDVAFGPLGQGGRGDWKQRQRGALSPGLPRLPARARDVGAHQQRAGEDELRDQAAHEGGPGVPLVRLAGQTGGGGGLLLMFAKKWSE